MNTTQAQLLGEQLARLRDNLDARLERIETALQHHQALDDERHHFLEDQLGALRSELGDHELRLRSIGEGVTTFRTWVSVVSGGSLAASLGALVKAILGG